MTAQKENATDMIKYIDTSTPEQFGLDAEIDGKRYRITAWHRLGGLEFRLTDNDFLDRGNCPAECQQEWLRRTKEWDAKYPDPNEYREPVIVTHPNLLAGDS